MQKITPFLTFKDHAEEAINFYVSLFKNSKIHSIFTHEGKVLHAVFELNGTQFLAMDGGEPFTFSIGTSLFVNCENQEEVDELWDKLTHDGGRANRCGWLTDKYGMSWQIIPKQLGELMSQTDKEKSARVMQAMLAMSKIDVSLLQKAYDGE